MEWNKLIESRSTQFAFADTPVDFDHIQSVVLHTLENVPSKQVRQPYIVHCVRNTPELKLKFAEWTHRDPELSVEEDLGNPQSQAPCVLIFESNPTKNYNRAELESWLEIGIVSVSINYALIDAGYVCGYCRCFSEPDHNDKVGSELLAEHFGFESPPIAIMGVGYASDSNQWWDPRTNSFKPIPSPRIDRKHQSEIFKSHI